MMSNLRIASKALVSSFDAELGRRTQSPEQSQRPGIGAGSMLLGTSPRAKVATSEYGHCAAESSGVTTMKARVVRCSSGPGTLTPDGIAT